MGCSRVRFHLSEKESRLCEALDETLGSLGFNLAQVREFSLGRDLISLRRANFRLSKLKRKLKIFIFYFESLVYYCLLFLSENSKIYL